MIRGQMQKLTTACFAAAAAVAAFAAIVVAFAAIAVSERELESLRCEISPAASVPAFWLFGRW